MFKGLIEFLKSNQDNGKRINILSPFVVDVDVPEEDVKKVMEEGFELELDVLQLLVEALLPNKDWTFLSLVN